jgi:hypothetical protein
LTRLRRVTAGFGGYDYFTGSWSSVGRLG